VEVGAAPVDFFYFACLNLNDLPIVISMNDVVILMDDEMILQLRPEDHTATERLAISIA
jgi:hypothetical protein